MRRGPAWVRLKVPVSRHVLVAASAWGSRVVSALVQLVAVRLLLQELDLDGYAVFALLTGLQGWFLLADLGVGFSAQNHLSEARAGNRSGEQVIFAARLLAVLLLLLTVLSLLLVAPYLSAFLLKSFDFLTPERKSELLVVAGSLSIGVAIGSIVYRIWYAEQRGYLSNLVPACASLVSLALIALIGRLPEDVRLVASVAAFIGPTAVIPMLVLFWQLRHDLPHGAARLNLPVLVAILKRGAGFWLFALMAALTLQIDVIVLSQFLGAREIASYSLATKIYGLAFFVYNAMLMALWPIFTELITQRLHAEVRRMLRRYLVYGIIYMVACSIAMVWMMPVALRLLSPEVDLSPPPGLVLLLGLYYVIRVWSDTFSVVLQSMSKMRALWMLVPVQAVLSVALQWTLAPHFGLYGVIGGLILSFVLTVVWGLPAAARRYALTAPGPTP